MLACVCRRDNLKRRSMARPLRDSSSTSASSSIVAVTRFQFHVGEQFEGDRDAEISASRLSDRRLRLAAHRFQIELLQFLFEGSHRIPFRIRE